MDDLLKLLIVPVLAVILAQLISFAVKSRHKKKILWSELVNTGGFPSSHSALMASLTVGILFVDGFGALFILSFFVMLIVIRDAIGVRREVGQIAEKINRVFKKSHLNESAGHTFGEVFAGLILGILVAVLAFI